MGRLYDRAKGTKTSAIGKKQFAIKKASRTPGKGKRKTFAIQEVTAVKGGGDTRVTLSLPELDAINESLASGLILYETALKHVTVIRDDLYKERDKYDKRVIFTKENYDLLDKYWAAKYETRHLQDKDTMLWDLRRAIKALGRVSLKTASQRDLQKALNDSFTGKNNKHRRAVSRLNQLLTWLGRGFVLEKMKPLRSPVHHITQDDLPEFLGRLRNHDFRLLCEIAFHTGLRVGEICSLEKSSIKKDHLWVETQLDEETLDARPTKTGGKRKVLVIERRFDLVDQWLALPLPRRHQLRQLRHAPPCRRASRRAFPDDRIKDICFHDLRHSYAIHLIGLGAPITLVAQCLGNSVSVCESSYSGFVLSDAGLDTLYAIMDKHKDLKDAAAVKAEAKAKEEAPEAGDSPGKTAT